MLILLIEQITVLKLNRIPSHKNLAFLVEEDSTIKSISLNVQATKCLDLTIAIMKQRFSS